MKNNMHKQNQSDTNDFHSLAEDARALMAATADVAGDKVAEARQRLTAALDSGGKLLGRAKDKAIEGAKYTDKVVRENPYQAIAIAAGVGALIGYLVARRSSGNGS